MPEVSNLNSTFVSIAESFVYMTEFIEEGLVE